jgi:hypothetical protein
MIRFAQMRTFFVAVATLGTFAAGIASPQSVPAGVSKYFSWLRAIPIP